jgi:hypothetical protein
MKDTPLPWTLAVPALPGWYILAAEVWNDDKSSFRVGRYPIVGWTILEGDEYEGVAMCTPVSPVSMITHAKVGILTPDGSVHRPMTADYTNEAEFIDAISKELGIPPHQDIAAEQAHAEARREPREGCEG